MKTCENCNFLNAGNYGSGRFCSSKCARGFSTKRKRKEINKKVSLFNKNKLAAGISVGFCKQLLPQKYICTCVKCEKKFEVVGAKNKRKTCSKKCYLNRSGIGGGYRKGSGRGKSGRYNGYWCDSSYELAWIIYNLEHGIKFKRNTEKFSYVFEGIERKYIPDFIVNKEYVEIKNYKSAVTDAKINQFPFKIKILYKNDLEDIFKYVINKHGKDFIKLYE
jgi:hypothetical protein